jgi:Ca2+-transporting ATPase
MAAPLYSLPVDEVERFLASDAERGLSVAEVEARFRRSGPNRLERNVRPPYARMALRQIRDPLVLLLLVAVAASAVVGESVEAAIIAAIVLVNGILGFAQELSSERAVLALGDSVPRHAAVVREGGQVSVLAEEVVPGDLLVLREGERVAADARVAEAHGLAVDEAPLTGESLPVEKDADPVPEEAALADRTGMVYAGTAVTRGRGVALVTSTGMTTEVGRISKLTARAKSPRTPLQRRIDGLARIMAGAGIVITVALSVAMAARGSSFHEAFLVGVSVAVAAVPEGLAATVTIALALGARAMARRGAIVRQLSAVETLGSATLVASDKTGTLTKNELQVVKLQPAPGVDEHRLLTAGALASSAELMEANGTVRVLGDPVDGAILLRARELGIAVQQAREGRRRLLEVPFDAARKRMTIVYGDSHGVHAFVKGAPEVILERSMLPDEERSALGLVAERWAGEGLRVLAVGQRELGEGDSFRAEDAETALIPLGLVGLIDPPRETAIGAVAEAHGAGLKVEMLTGDHPLTAASVGRALGLPPDAIHARVTPEEKLRIVESRQADGEVVAVTGDGVNDAPALRRADVGVAMGLGGTEAAREASDLVLTNDDFATIIAAIREGRGIADNIRKFVAFLLSANLGEVVLFAVAILAGLGAPMTVVQVLLINVMTDGLPAVALARDAASPATMTRPPERSRHLFPPLDWVALLLIGLVVGGVGLCAFLVGPGGDAAQTRAFATIAISELVLVFTVRSRLVHAWREPRNPYLLGGVAVSAGIVALALFMPTLNKLLDTSRPDASDILLIVGLALVPALFVEGLKECLARGWLPGAHRAAGGG